VTPTPPRRSLAEAIRRAVALGLADAHSSLPARVTRVDLAAGVVDAVPLIMDVIDDGAGGRRAVAFPVVTNVPIQVANGGGFRITFPWAVGDVCTLVFADRSIDVWLAKGGGPVDPIDPRAHALSDGVVAIPSTNPSAPWTIDAAAMTLGKEGGLQIKIANGEIDLGAATDFVALATAVGTQLTALKTAINGWVVVPGDGGGALKAALTTLFAAWPSSVAATKVKAE
jgi:hypothetical protein